MANPDGKKFKFESEDSINSDFLETFDYPGKPQVIRIEYPEFSALCPFSGLPDLGNVIIEYIPSSKCIELKSLKYYFISFRNVGIYQEKVTDRVFKDLKGSLTPKYVKVRIIYNRRGGMDTETTMEWGNKNLT